MYNILKLFFTEIFLISYFYDWIQNDSMNKIINYKYRKNVYKYRDSYIVILQKKNASLKEISSSVRYARVKAGVVYGGNMRGMS